MALSDKHIYITHNDIYIVICAQKSNFFFNLINNNNKKSREKKTAFKKKVINIYFNILIRSKYFNHLQHTERKKNENFELYFKIFDTNNIL